MHKSQCRNTINVEKKKDNMTHPKVNESTIMDFNDGEMDEI
jgi:hypothetical protein